MTYCVGVLLDEGLVLASDSRTNAGVDYVSSFRKMSVFDVPGERVFVLLSAGNLATTQSVVALIGERFEDRNNHQSIYNAESVFKAARLVGDTLREVLDRDAGQVRKAGGDASASFILGGQVKGRPHRLFQIYDAGNFIEATPETPFVQIGETKYGKPILDRIISPDIPMATAAKCVLVSFDSTMRSNLSVGPPIDLLIYRKDSYDVSDRREVEEDDRYFAALRRGYGEGIVTMFQGLPDPDWL